MSAPVKHTCPEIDKYIKSIKYEIVKLRELKAMSESELLETASSMSSELENCIDYLESLRSSNQELREWGEGLYSELQDAGEQINELEAKLEAINMMA